MDTYPKMEEVPIKVLVNRDNAPLRYRKLISIIKAATICIRER